MVVKIICRSLLQETYEVQDTFFYDDATTDKSSIYDVANRIILNRQSTGTVTLAHNNNKYDITASSMGNYGLINIPSLTGINKPFELSMDIITMLGEFGFQLNNTDGKFIMGVQQSEMFRIPYTSNINSSNWGVEDIQPVSIFNNIKLVCQFNGNTMNVKVYDNNNGNILYNYTSTLASSLNNETNTVNYGLIMYDGSYSFKNLKVKPL